MDIAHLNELHGILGLKSADLEPSVIYEVAEPVDADAAEEDAALKDFSRVAGMALKQFTGQSFPTENGSASINIQSVRGLAVDPNSEKLEVVAPLIVTYTGKASGPEWAFAEKVYERLVRDSIQRTAEQFMEEPKVVFLRRKKTDPFEGDLRSLTLLRYRIEA